MNDANILESVIEVLAAGCSDYESFQDEIDVIARCATPSGIIMLNEASKSLVEKRNRG